MNNILLVEDDLSIIDGLVFSIKKNGFNVDVVRTVKEAILRYQSHIYDLLLLDLTLPDGKGFEICEHVRQTSQIPIIFLTASDEEINIVKGLDIGGDDYITKPFKLNELISRIKALLRRVASFQEPAPIELKSNGIIVKLLENRVFKNNVELDFSPNEYKLLCIFMQNPSIVLTRETILNKLLDDKENFIDDNTLSVYVRRLRNKVEDDANSPNFLTTIRGLGYRWSVIL